MEHGKGKRLRQCMGLHLDPVRYYHLSSPDGQARHSYQCELHSNVGLRHEACPITEHATGPSGDIKLMPVCR